MEKEYKFSDLKDDIYQAIEKLDNKGYFGKNSLLSIVEGFTFIPVQDTAGGDIVIGSVWGIPVVNVVNTTDGRIWQFALPELVPALKRVQ